MKWLDAPSHLFQIAKYRGIGNKELFRQVKKINTFIFGQKPGDDEGGALFTV